MKFEYDLHDGCGQMWLVLLIDVQCGVWNKYMECHTFLIHLLADSTRISAYLLCNICKNELFSIWHGTVVDSHLAGSLIRTLQ